MSIKVKVKRFTAVLSATATALTSLSPIGANLAHAQDLKTQTANDQSNSDVKSASAGSTSVSISNSQVSVKYKSNLNTNINQFLLPNGKIVVDFTGVEMDDKIDLVAQDLVIERVQMIEGNGKSRLIVSVKKDFIEYLNAKKITLSASNLLVSQSPDNTIISLKQELLPEVKNYERYVIARAVQEKSNDLAARGSESGMFNQNITDETRKVAPVSNQLQVATQSINQSVEQPANSSSNNAASAAVVLEKDTNSALVTLEKIAFSRTIGTNGRLTLDLSNASSFASVKRADNLLIIEIPGLKVPDELKKKLSTANLSLATKSVEILSSEAGVKIIAEQSGFWEHTYSQADKRVVIDIKTLTQEQSKLKAEAEAEKNKSYTGKSITLNFQNMEVRALLQVISDFTGINIVASDKVQGSMTIKLNNVPWEQALDIILESKDLTKLQKGNIIWVATRDEYNQKQKSQIETQAQAYELEPIKLMTYQLNFHKASDLATFLIGGRGASSSSSIGASVNVASTESGSNRILSKKGTVNFDARNNILFVQDTQAKLDEVSKIIRQLDSSARQVLVEAKIVIADEKFSRDLGVRYGLQVGAGRGNSRAAIGSTPSTASTTANRGNVSTDPATGAVTVLSPATAIDLAAGTGASTIAFSILNAVSGNALNLELSAMEQDNRGRVISSPRIVTFDNQQATIEQGTEIPYVTPGSGTSPPTVAFKKAVLGLGVTPQISPNGRISLKLDIKKDTVGELVSVQGGGTVPSIDTRNLQTNVTVKNGQTIILGGVYESISREDLRKIPFLGDLPVVGNFFKNSIKGKDRAELLIFITPYVIEDSTLDADSSVGDTVEMKKIGK